MFIKNYFRRSQKPKQPQSPTQSLANKLFQLVEQYQVLSKSDFYTSYLKIMLQPILQTFNPKMKQLNNSLQQESIFTIQKLQANILISISQQNGILYKIINLWVSYFEFKVKIIIQQSTLNKTVRSQRVLKFFQNQYFLLSFYLKPIQQAEIEQSKLLTFIRNRITQCDKFSIIHNYIIKNVIIQVQHLSEKQVEENMKDLQKLCRISKVPIPFQDCLLYLKKFYRQHILLQKINIAVTLIQTIRNLIGEYRSWAELNTQCLIAADDIFSVLAYAFWRINKNIYGACAYIEAILCSQYSQINFEVTANQLQKIGPDCRHSFETIKSVSNLGLIPLEILNKFL